MPNIREFIAIKGKANTGKTHIIWDYREYLDTIDTKKARILNAGSSLNTTNITIPCDFVDILEVNIQGNNEVVVIASFGDNPECVLRILLEIYRFWLDNPSQMRDIYAVVFPISTGRKRSKKEIISKKIEDLWKNEATRHNQTIKTACQTREVRNKNQQAINQDNTRLFGCTKICCWHIVA